MILNAIFYLNRTSCQWSMLPKDYPPKSTVFDYFSAWCKSGLWVELNDRLRVKVRGAAGRKPAPTAAILDSQSVKGAEQGGAAIGYDAGKKIGGRKRHILVDTLGMLLGVCVTSASSRTATGRSTCSLASTFSLAGCRSSGPMVAMPVPWSHGSKGCVPSASCIWTSSAAAMTPRASNSCESAGLIRLRLTLRAALQAVCLATLGCRAHLQLVLQVPPLIPRL